MSYNKIKLLMNDDWIMYDELAITFTDLAGDPCVENALPAENLQDSDPTKPIQTTGTELAITFDLTNLPKPYDIGTFIGNHNFTSVVEIHALFDSANDFSSPIADITFDLTDFIDDTNMLNTEALFNALFFWITESSALSHDWLRITIEDPTNTDGFLRFGIASIGPIGAEQNITHQITKGAISTETIIETANGITHSRQQKETKTVTVNFQYVSLEMYNRFRRWVAEGGFQKERWICLSPNAGERGKHTYFGRIVTNGITEVHKTDQRGLYNFSFTMTDLIPQTRNVPQIKYSTYLEFIRQPLRTDSFKAILAPREPSDPVSDPIAWTVESGACYKTDYPFNTDEAWNVWGVYQGGIALEAADDIADCVATEGTYFFDIAAERVLYAHGTNSEDLSDELMQVAPLIAFCSAVNPSLKFPILSIPSTYNGLAIPLQLFEARLSSQGLSDISWEMESAYIGFAVPQLHRIGLINGKTNYKNVNGPFDKWVERFQWRDTEVILLHGDMGVTLSFPATRTSASDEFAHMGTFKILDVELMDDSFTINIDSQISELNKKIPSDYYTDTFEPRGDDAV